MAGWKTILCAYPDKAFSEFHPCHSSYSSEESGGLMAKQAEKTFVSRVKWRIGPRASAPVCSADGT